MQRNLLWYSRMVMLGVWMSVATVWHFFRILPMGKSSVHNSSFVWLCYPIARRILGLQFVVRKHKPNLPGPFVYIMNHQSALDLFSAVEVYPKDCILVVKTALGKIPFFGWILKLGNNVFLDRANHEKSLDQMALAKSKMLSQNLSVWVFPEGTRRKTGLLHAFKQGAFHLATQAKVPVFPVVASGYSRAVDFNRWKSGTIIVEMLPCIESNSEEWSSVDELKKQCHKVMSAAFERITQESLAFSGLET